MTVDLSSALRDRGAGPALAAAAEGRLLLRRCRACRDAHYYPRVPCPFCGGDELEWEQAAGTGRIYSYSVTYQGPEPWVIAYVTLTEGPTLMTNIVDTPHAELAVDLEVELVTRETPHGIHAPFFPGEARMTIPAMLDRTVELFGDRPAMWHADRRWIFAELDAMADQVAAWLLDHDVAPGDRIAVRMPNDPAFPIWAHGVWRVGATLVSINPLYARDAAAGILADSGARVLLIADDGVELPAKAVVRDLQAEVLMTEATFERIDVDPDTVAVLQYTGGTTGAPKGAMLTHANLVAGQAQLAERCPELLLGEERLFSAVPMSHVSGLVLAVLASANLAAEMLIVPRFAPEEAVKLVDELRPTFFPIVPTMATALLRLGGRGSFPEDRWSSVKVITAGAAPLAKDLQRRFEALTGCRVRPSYGGTETSAIATLTPSDGASPGSPGAPMPDTTIEIRSLTDPGSLAPPGEPGEIAVRGPQVAAGYWNRPEATAEFFRDGTFRSGDIGYVDEDGFLHVVDRLKDMIIASGYNVYPATVERAVFTHPAVAETIVIGVPDDYRGEDVKAFVVLNPGHTLTLEELRAHLRPLLSPMELPRQLEIRDELPKTAVGKLSRKDLRDEVNA